MTRSDKYMPKIAFVIMAHTGFEQLNIFIKQLLAYEGAVVFIHVDKKSQVNVATILKHERVRLLTERISVNWGDYSQIEATLQCMNAVLDADDFEYISLHSGADLAVRPVEEFARYIGSSQYELFASSDKLPVKGWGHGGGLERVALRYPKLFRRKVSRGHIIRFMRAYYQILYEKGIINGRNISQIKNHLSGGSQWFTAKTSLIKRAMRYRKIHPEYDELFKDALIPDEIYFQTLFSLVNAVLLNDNLRYIDWRTKNTNEAGSPKLLLTDDIGQIEDSGKFFGRKFNLSVDEKVVSYFYDKTNGGTV